MAATAVLSPALDPAALRRARRAAGYTLDDAGRAVGRTGAALSRYETGDVDPPTSMTAALAGLYDVEVGSLFTQ
jgi:transcriptional regulator with XRE-family HTH domain